MSLLTTTAGERIMLRLVEQNKRRNKMTDPKKRADRWKAKYNLKRVNETLTDLREDMAARYEAAMNQVYATRGT